jgi:hypothetical protein
MKEIRVQKGKQSKATRVQKGQPSKAIRVQRGQSVLQTDPKAVPTSPHGEAAESTITAPQPPPKQTQADHHPLKHHPGSQPDPVVMLMSSDDAAERTITSLESSSEQLQADYPPNRRPRLQPDPVAMQTSPDEAAERAMPSPEPSPDQQQVDEHPSDAMEVTQDDPDAFWHEQRTITMAQFHAPITMSPQQQQPQLEQQAHVQAQWDQQSVSRDDMDVDSWQPTAGAARSLAEPFYRFVGDTHAIVLGTGGDTAGSVYRVGNFATSSPDRDANWEGLYDEFLDFSQGQ